jgi:hypothetical protein
MFQVTQQNHAVMQYLLSGAMKEFEEMTFLDGMTLNLVRRYRLRICFAVLDF